MYRLQPAPPRAFAARVSGVTSAHTPRVITSKPKPKPSKKRRRAVRDAVVINPLMTDKGFRVPPWFAGLRETADVGSSKAADRLPTCLQECRLLSAAHGRRGRHTMPKKEQADEGNTHHRRRRHRRRQNNVLSLVRELSKDIDVTLLSLREGSLLARAAKWA